MLLVVGLVPLVVTVARGRRFLYSPVGYLAWFHVLPSLAFGAFVLSVGFTPPFYDRMPAPVRDLSFTAALLAVGFVALYIGFWLPFGASAGRTVGRWLPDPDWPADRIVPAAIALLALGALLSAAAFDRGLLGYQTPAEPTRGSAALAMAAVIATRMALLMLFYAVMVLRPSRPRVHTIAVVVLGTWILVDFLISGRRGALFEAFVLAGGVWALLGAPFRHLAWIATALVAAVFAGMIYGTTFRHTLGETTTTAEQYVGATEQAAQTIVERGVVGNTVFALDHLVQRVEIVSSAAVIVGRAEQEEEREADYGLKDNIRTSILYSLVPRSLWPDKPSVSDPRALTRLYFGYDNSNAVTPVADLYRNFGTLGVPLGMLALGILLRVLWVALIENRTRSLARSVAYLVLLISVSYEGFFGAIVPTLIRTGVVVAVLGAGVHLIAGVRVPERHADSNRPGNA
jgi:hypothetical protein